MAGGFNLAIPLPCQDAQGLAAQLERRGGSSEHMVGFQVRLVSMQRPRTDLALVRNSIKFKINEEPSVLGGSTGTGYKARPFRT